MEKCPNFNELVLYNQGLISRYLRTQVKNHVASCQACSRKLATAEELLALLEVGAEPELERTPQKLLKSVLSQIPVQKKRKVERRKLDDLLGSLRRIVAEIMIPPTVLGEVRSTASVPTSWHGLYQTDQVEISLSTKKENAIGLWTIAGRIFPRSGDQTIPRQVEVFLLETETMRGKSRIRDDNSFDFRKIEPGVYTLAVRLADDLIEVRNLPVGEGLTGAFDDPQNSEMFI